MQQIYITYMTRFISHLEHNDLMLDEIFHHVFEFISASNEWRHSGRSNSILSKMQRRIRERKNSGMYTPNLPFLKKPLKFYGRLIPYSFILSLQMKRAYIHHVHYKSRWRMTDIWWAGDSPLLQNLTAVLQVTMFVWYNWGMEHSRRLDDENCCNY